MDDRLKLLFDYTKFHIGLYATLVTGALALMNFEVLRTEYLRPIKLTVALFLVAGAAGGVIASNIPWFTDFEAFAKSKIGSWHFKLMSPDYWARLEHGAFWAGILIAYGAFVCGP